MIVNSIKTFNPSKAAYPANNASQTQTYSQNPSFGNDLTAATQASGKAKGIVLTVAALAAAFSLFTASLTSCGGGGGGKTEITTPTDPPVDPPVDPGVTLSSSQNDITTSLLSSLDAKNAIIDTVVKVSKAVSDGDDDSTVTKAASSSTWDVTDIPSKITYLDWSGNKIIKVLDTTKLTADSDHIVFNCTETDIQGFGGSFIQTYEKTDDPNVVVYSIYVPETGKTSKFKEVSSDTETTVYKEKDGVFKPYYKKTPTGTQGEFKVTSLVDGSDLGTIKILTMLFEEQE